MMFAAVVCGVALLGSPGDVEWTADAEAGLGLAAEQGRVVLLALGEAGEARSERHLKEVYGAKALREYLGESVNLAAWSSYSLAKQSLPKLGGYTPTDHASNLELFTQRWLRPNAKGVVALPQHLWLSPEGELLLSCPFEIDVEEFAWCFDEALRRAGVRARPEPMDGAHPPRRMLLGEVYQVGDDDDLGRGLRPDELTAVLDRFKRRELSEADGADIRRILFTDEEAGAKVMTRELAGWDLAAGKEDGWLAGVLDGTVHLIGLRATAVYLPALEQFSRHPRTSLRVQVAVAYEQIGDPGGLAAVKRALKKEKEDEVRAEWVRALGACGRGNATVAKTLIRLARKERNDRVRLSAIFALGHLLPEDGAREFLGELVAQGADQDRRAALLALALGRAVDARPIVAELAQGDGDAGTREVAAAALAVLDGGNLIGMREAVLDVVRSDVDRWRVFFWRGG